MPLCGDGEVSSSGWKIIILGSNSLMLISLEYFGLSRHSSSGTSAPDSPDLRCAPQPVRTDLEPSARPSPRRHTALSRSQRPLPGGVAPEANSAFCASKISWNLVARRCTPRRRSTTRSSSKVNYGSNSMTARRCIPARAISWLSRRRDTGGATKANVRQLSFFSCSARNLTTTHETESCDPDKPSFVHTRRRTHLRTASLPHHPKGHELCAQP